jgi:hypothetical protein
MTNFKVATRWILTHVLVLAIGTLIGYTQLAQQVILAQQVATNQIMCVNGYMAYCRVLTETADVKLPTVALGN